MSLKNRIIYWMVLDSIIVLSAIYFSNFILLPTRHFISGALIISSITLLFSHHLFAYLYKLYQRAWEYASIGEMIAIFKAVTFSIIVTAIVQWAYIQDIYLRALMITWMIHILLIGGSRFSWRLYRDTYLLKKTYKKRALIIGAGAAGTMIVRQLKQNHNDELLPVAFIDDDVKKHHLNIMGIPVIGGIEQVQQAVKDLAIDNIVIAIPSFSKKDLNRIFAECQKTNAKTQIIPKIEDLMLGRVSVNQIRNVQIEDLLGREPVELDSKPIAKYIKGKVLLITGAGGSIGSEICRQVSQFSPEKMILLGHGENSIYSIELELKETFSNQIEFVTEIADVQDRDKIFTIMEKHHPDVVFHAAAHKHVPLMERNPEEAVKNNVIGTKNVAEAASYYNVEAFVMVSTDKAVNPTSVMGATKRIAEMIVQHMDSISHTRFVAVRFGNVLGSRGSVIPLFKEQIKKGGPVTVTHPDMIRYFMTIPEASRLVIQAGALAKGGEIFVLDMGEPVKIVDLAKNLIKLSGYTEEEIEIVFTGIRPGEKLFEEILNKNEVHDKQIYPKIYVGKSINVDFELIENLLDKFRDLETEALRKELLDIANHRKTLQKKVLIAQ
ncbi:MAG: polysaccharide biosynthesis protein [Tepidibacillus sp.]